MAVKVCRLNDLLVLVTIVEELNDEGVDKLLFTILKERAEVINKILEKVVDKFTPHLRRDLPEEVVSRHNVPRGKGVIKLQLQLY